MLNVAPFLDRNGENTSENPPNVQKLTEHTQVPLPELDGDQLRRKKLGKHVGGRYIDLGKISDDE